MVAVTPLPLYLRIYRLTFGGGQVPWNGSLAVSAAYYQMEPRAQFRLSDTGAWSVSAVLKQATALPWTAAVATETLVPQVGSVVLIRLWNSVSTVETNLVAGIVESSSVTWADGDEVAKLVISGRTWSSILEAILVYPVGGTTRKPFSDSRTFSWASPEYDASGWAAAKQLATYAAGSTAWTLDSGIVAPDGWPYSPTAYWIWADNPGGATSTSTSADVGTCLFRRTWTNPTTQRYAFFITADNYYVFYIDGIEVAANRDDPFGWQSTTRFECDVTSGTHVFAIRGENIAGTGANPGGVMMAVKVVNPDGTLTNPASDGVGPILTDANWKVRPYVTAPYPGITVYNLWNTLVAEANARDTDNTGPLRMAAWQWTTTNDSAGQAWTELPEITISVGASMLDVWRTLTDQVGIIWTDAAQSNSQSNANMLGLSAFQGSIPNSDVATFTLGVDLMALSFTTEG